MKREEFLKKGIVALGGVVALTGIAASAKKNNKVVAETSENCDLSPRETKGPFPNKTPSDYVRENMRYGLCHGKLSGNGLRFEFT